MSAASGVKGVNTGAPVLGQQLAASVDALVDLDLRGTSSTAIADLLIEVHRQASRLESVKLSLTAAFERAGGPTSAGYRDVQHWLQMTLRKSPGDARRQAQTARRLEEDLPDTRRALQDGEISGEHAEAIAKAAADLPPDHIDRAEGILLSTARDRDPRNVAREGRRLSQAADREAARLKARRAYHQRTFSLRDDGAGSFFANGRLHQYAGQKVLAALKALAASKGRDDERSHGQRMADALVELVERAESGAGLPQEGGFPAHVLVTIPAQEVDVRAGRPVGTTATSLGGDLSEGGPALPQTFEQILCEADLEWLITSSDGEPLRYGRTRREPTRAQRRALHHQYGGCAWPGCHAAVRRVVIHHEPPFDRGGRTDVETMVPLCPYHHALRHHSGWRLELHTGGAVTVTSPKGDKSTQTPAECRAHHQQRVDGRGATSSVAAPDALQAADAADPQRTRVAVASGSSRQGSQPYVSGTASTRSATDRDVSGGGQASLLAESPGRYCAGPGTARAGHDPGASRESRRDGSRADSGHSRPRSPSTRGSGTARGTGRGPP